MTVKTTKLKNINDEDLYYITIETEIGKLNISIGEKNYNKLQIILGEIETEPEQE